MKNLFVCLFLCCVFSSPFDVLSQEANSAFGKEFLPVWKRAQAYTLEVAEAMPADQYGFSGAEGVMNFGEQMVHITANLYGLSSRFIVEEKASYQKPSAEDLSKAEIIKQLTEAFDYVSQALVSMEDEEMQAEAPGFWAKEPTSKSIIFLLMRDHMTHHRGQCILFLRMNNLKPPRYRGW